MPTVREICTRALRKLDALGRGEAPDGDSIEEAVNVYNDMLHGWRLFQVDIEHTTQDVNDTFPLDDQFVEGVTYILAAQLSPNYTIPPTFNIDAWWRAIQARYMTIDAVTIDAGLENLPSQRYRRYF